MNYFKIGDRQYRAEVCGSANPITGEQCFDVNMDVLGGSAGIFPRARLVRNTRPAARRALAREIERLAIGPDGKRTNFEVVYSMREFEAWTRRVAGAASELAGSMRSVGDAFERHGDSASKIIKRAAVKAGVPVGEFVARVRGEP